MIALQSGSGDSVSDESRSGVGVSLFSNASRLLGGDLASVSR